MGWAGSHEQYSTRSGSEQTTIPLVAAQNGSYMVVNLVCQRAYSSTLRGMGKGTSSPQAQPPNSQTRLWHQHALDTPMQA